MRWTITLTIIGILLLGMLSANVNVKSAKSNTVQNITLYGGISPLGWGFDSSTITNPGPLISTTEGETINLTLISADGLSHEFFVDYNGDGSPSPGEPRSGTFGTTPHNFQFVANVTGSFTYRCVIHPSMVGPFNVTAIPEFPSFLILPLFMLATLVAVLAYKRNSRKTRQVSKTETK